MPLALRTHRPAVEAGGWGACCVRRTRRKTNSSAASQRPSRRHDHGTATSNKAKGRSGWTVVLKIILESPMFQLVPTFRQGPQAEPSIRPCGGAPARFSLPFFLPRPSLNSVPQCGYLTFPPALCALRSPVQAFPTRPCASPPHCNPRAPPIPPAARWRDGNNVCVQHAGQPASRKGCPNPTPCTRLSACAGCQRPRRSPVSRSTMQMQWCSPADRAGPRRPPPPSPS